MSAYLKVFGLGSGLLIGAMGMATNVQAQPLNVVYPPNGHETTAAQIFLIGTATPGGNVTVNGQSLERSPAGHFAPSFPLQLGENVFTLRHGSETLTLNVTRLAETPSVPLGVAFVADSLVPAVNIARLPNQPICLGAIAPPNATVSVTLAGQTIPLAPQPNQALVPPNSAVLTDRNQPILGSTAQSYQGCTTFDPGLSRSNPANSGSANLGVIRSVALPQGTNLGQPTYQLRLNGQTLQQQALGTVELLSVDAPRVVAVTADPGTARTGPSTDYSRLTPLPQGTQASVVGIEGDWLQLDYGGWIRTRETAAIASTVPPRTLIRGIRSRQVDGWTEVVFPLQVPVPISLHQGDRHFTLTLYNTTAQTDTIFVPADTVIQRLDWQQLTPGQVEYRFNLKSAQQWGYKLRYEGTSLVLSSRHPPLLVRTRDQTLAGVRVLIDPGHGGADDLGARGPTGYPEKDAVLVVGNRLRDRLTALGATVIMTREQDIDLDPNARAALVTQQEPDLALSLHFNALPDDGDAINTSGIGTFWYQSQSYGLAQFLHDYLVENLDRPSYGVFWNNLALTRPTVTPAVLIELGFMINPTEFEWITDVAAQEKLADTLATGIEAWLQTTADPSGGGR